MPHAIITVVIRAHTVHTCCVRIRVLQLKASRERSIRQQRAAAAQELFDAVLARQPSHVRSLLLRCGDELSNRARTASGATALHYAASVGCVECIRLLAGPAIINLSMDGIALTALHVAAGGGHCNAVKLLLEAKSQLSSSAALGETALHVAAQCGAIDVMTAAGIGGSLGGKSTGMPKLDTR